jgi:flagellar biogenesis protein FliO
LNVSVFFTTGYTQEAKAGEQTAETEQVFNPKTRMASGAESHVSPYFLVTIYAVLFAGGGYCVYLLSKKKMLGGFTISKTNKAIKIIETTMLGNRQFLVLVECEGEKFLLGVGNGFINKISSIGTRIEDLKFDSDLAKELERTS